MLNGAIIISLVWVLTALLFDFNVQGVAAVMEVGRSLYFMNNPANRNIGGGLQVLSHG